MIHRIEIKNLPDVVTILSVATASSGNVDMSLISATVAVREDVVHELSIIVRL